MRNAINDEMRAQFVAALDRAGNDEAVRAVVLTGNGKSFCSGGDISGMRDRLQAPSGKVAFNGWRRQQQTHRSVAALHGMGKVTIAAVNGAAAGLGCDMALACDFIVASEEAVFSMSFVRRGLVSDGGGMYFLPRRVGLSRAKEMIFTGRPVGSTEALAIGLADRVHPAATLVHDATAWARDLSRGSMAAIASQRASWTAHLKLRKSRSLRSAGKPRPSATRPPNTGIRYGIPRQIRTLGEPIWMRWNV